MPTDGGWGDLAPGHALTVIKLAPDGDEVARYPGEVVAIEDGGAWVVVRAVWTRRTVELDGLSFCAGDELLEWFSPDYGFNAFAVHAPDGALKGWYANVTHPARLDVSVVPAALIWHDLYVDLVGLPDGTFTVRDEDELEASALAERDSRLYQQILGGRDAIVDRFRRELVPFRERGLEAGEWRERPR